MSEGCILVVDDEPFNMDILISVLGDAGYETVSASDGGQAWEALLADPERFDAVVADRMMPNMNGMELLERIKANQQFAMLPVIMQTARTANEDIAEGLEAGAWYYLCKPFDDHTLLAVVRTATQEYQTYRAVVKEAAGSARCLRFLNQGVFTFRTVDEARDLASLLSNTVENGDRLAIGLIELFLNAVEHGNLGIGYQAKSMLNQTGDWEAEVARRQALPDNQAKVVSVTFRRMERDVYFRIRDEGKGFDWESYLQFDPERAFDTHGRGIALARNMSFSRLEYLGSGNEVVAVYSL